LIAQYWPFIGSEWPINNCGFYTLTVQTENGEATVLSIFTGYKHNFSIFLDREIVNNLVFWKYNLSNITKPLVPTHVLFKTGNKCLTIRPATQISITCYHNG